MVTLGQRVVVLLGSREQRPERPSYRVHVWPERAVAPRPKRCGLDGSNVL